MHSHSPIGVIFDMDGVPVDSAQPHYESWRTLAAEQGVDLRRERLADLTIERLTAFAADK